MKPRVLLLAAALALAGCASNPTRDYLSLVSGYSGSRVHGEAALPRAVLKAHAPAPAFDPAILMPGDELLYAPTDLIGDIICVVTGDVLKSHVEGYLGNGQVIAARSSGVGIYPVRIDASLACVRRSPNCERFDTNAAYQAVAPFIGKPYDIPGLFRFLCPWSTSTKPILVCSPIVTMWSRGGGCEPLNPDVLSNRVTPGALFTTGGLFTVWRNPVIDRSFSTR